LDATVVCDIIGRVRTAKIIGWLSFCIAAGLSGLVRADSVWIGEPGHSPIETSGVKISGITGDTINYTLESGASKSESMQRVQQISVDGETSFDSAEAAFAAQKYDDALTGYQAALSSGKDWIKSRAAIRLIGLAKSKGKFDAEVAAFAQLVKSDAELAAANKPNKPSANTVGMDAALSTLSTALGLSSLTVPQKSALLNEEFDIYRAKGDLANETVVLGKLSDLGATTPAEMAMLKVAEANIACDNRDYAKATTLITANKAVITDPDLQVDALYILARAAEGQAGAGASDEKQKNVALAYMRAATFGEKLDGKPHVAESLLKTAAIEEALKDPKAALGLYQQITDDRVLKQTPEAKDAKSAVERLKAAGA
jgi:hypothetical protein